MKLVKNEYKKVLVVGGNSFVGRNLRTALSQESSYCLSYTSRSIDDPDAFHVDFNNLDRCLENLDLTGYDTVFWVASVKDVKWCEQNKIDARRINLDSLKIVLPWVAALNPNVKIVYISSDYVFSGSIGMYSPDSPADPKTYYGLLKLDAEKYLVESFGSCVVVRTSALFGEGGLFFDWLLSGLKGNNKLELFGNSYFTPTSISYFCNVLIDMLDDLNLFQSSRIVHVSGDCRLSRFELASRLKDARAHILTSSLIEVTCSDYLSHDTSLTSTYFGKQGSHQFSDLIFEVDKCIK